jgi:hypothetical protein
MNELGEASLSAALSFGNLVAAIKSANIPEDHTDLIASDCLLVNASLS